MRTIDTQTQHNCSEITVVP